MRFWVIGKDMITKEALDSVLRFDPNSGEFFWIHSRGRVKAGDRAGLVGTGGYIMIRVLGKTYAAHRLAWLTTYGNFPPNFLDHINRNPCDNRICNLRNVTQQENLFNKGWMTNNSSGTVGIRFRPEYNKWYSAIGVSGKQVHLGSFETEEGAKVAYQKAKLHYHKIGG